MIFILGWKDGKAGNENKTELPPPEDGTLYFGDLIFIKTKNNIIDDLTVEDYNYFYNKAFDGFESLGSSDSEESENDELDNDEYDSDDSFIDNSEQEIIITNNDEEYKIEQDMLDEDSKTSSSSSSNESLMSLDTELNNLQ